MSISRNRIIIRRNRVKLTLEEFVRSKERDSPGVVLFRLQRQPSFAGAEDVGQI